MKQRKGFTLIELMIVIAIIIILAAIAIPNYLKMTERARRSRVAGDFASIGTALEAYSVDWGYYPKMTVVQFGKAAPATNIIKELTGTGTQNDAAGTHTTITGEKSPIVYIKPETLTSMYDPFIPDTGYFYASDTDGTHWVLATQFKTGSDYLWRSDGSTDLTQRTGNASAVAIDAAGAVTP